MNAKRLAKVREYELRRSTNQTHDEWLAGCREVERLSQIEKERLTKEQATRSEKDLGKSFTVLTVSYSCGESPEAAKASRLLCRDPGEVRAALSLSVAVMRA